MARVDRDVVGLRREAEVLCAALQANRHVVLEGPPGTGKSTLLRAVADEAGIGLVFVEGNAELTPARLVGAHDPALVLERGYLPEAFTEGPLVAALRQGSLLYIEELNRVPEETSDGLMGPSSPELRAARRITSSLRELIAWTMCHRGPEWHRMTLAGSGHDVDLLGYFV